jgi:phosphatidylserine/phosphatidylglycerophosphate/cardiolipin synthase-like enzyme
MTRSLAVRIVANREHLGAIQDFLDGDLSRVRLCTYSIRDIQLVNSSLSLRLKRLLSTNCTVSVAFGEDLWKPGSSDPRDEVCRQTLAFLKDLEHRGATVWYVPRPMLHAKVVYVEGRGATGSPLARALVTSANLSTSATRGNNYELGVELNDLHNEPDLQQRVKDFTGRAINVGRSLEDVVRDL